jgi:aldehyde:ferredoxin oxidoreductase
MGNGYWQKLLRVDLTAGTSSVEDIAEADLKQLVGGAGLGAEILRREIPGKTGAYDPENRVIFATGPFQGHPVPGSAKFSIVGISPLSGTFADTAAGADFGPALKDAGYDLLVVQGKSEKPAYIQIVDDVVEIKCAGELWGKDTDQTIDAVRAEVGDEKFSVACIGPAGEKLVAIACIAVDKHSFAGRCGLGAVMGSKNLKAVAIKGTKKVEVNDPEKTKALIKKFTLAISETVKENEFREHGTPGLCESAEGLGDMPIKYWDGDVWPEGAKKLGAPNYTNVLKAKPLPCKYCPIGCHRKIEITDPPEYAGENLGPEYETLGMMGSNLMIDDPKAVARANGIANRLGVDTISVGAMIGFAMECFEKGWITTDDTDGMELKWGDPKVLIGLTEKIGNREGFGAIFADGTVGAAKKIGKGSEASVVHCKGLDFPAHDARSCISLAPTYATGTRGACHFRGPSEDVEMGGFFIPEVGVNEGDVKFFEKDNQSRVAAKCQDLGVVANSLVVCLFMIDGGDWTMTAVTEMLNAITGWDYTPQRLLETGERGFTVQRLVNNRDGYNASNDKMPKKMGQVAKEGFRKGKAIPFEELMADYYTIRGWDGNGEPSGETLGRLGVK